MELKNKASVLVLALAMLATLALSLTAGAAGPRAVRRQAESAMQVTGTLHTDAQGLVTGYALDQPEQLPEGVRTLLAGVIEHWRFQPREVGGKPVATSTDMNLLVLARAAGDGGFEVELASMVFGAREPETEEHIRSVAMPPPSFPRELLRTGATGTVYLLLRVGRDGKVEDAVAEQVNLRAVATDNRMDALRHQFAQAALRAPATWTFAPPTRGTAAQDAYWTVRVPVVFLTPQQAPAAYGRWETYIRGPRTPAPWEGDELAKAPGFSPDALPAGGAYAGGGLKLLVATGG